VVIKLPWKRLGYDFSRKIKMASVWLTESEVLKYVQECWDVSDKHWETYEKPIWDRSWQLYENKQDWSDKEDWQAKCFIPKTEGAIDTIGNLLDRALAAIKGWFGHEGIEEEDKKLAPHVNKIVMFWADFIKILDTILSAIKTSLIVGTGITKCHEQTYAKWEGSRTQGEGGLISSYDWEPIEAWKPLVEEVDPYDVRFSRDMELFDGIPKGSYIIERKDVEFTELLLNAKKMKYKVKKVRSEDYPKDGEKQKMARDQVKDDSSDIMHPIQLKELHGYVRIHPDKKVSGDKQGGERRYFFDENLKYVITVANDKNVIRVSGQRDDEYSYVNPNQEYVYRVFRPLPRNFKFYGKALANSIGSLQVMLNDIWNMIFDSIAFEIYKMFGVDWSKIDDSDDVKVAPSQIIRTTSNVNEVLQQLYIQPMSKNALAVPALVNQIMDRFTGVTPQVEAGMSQPGAETATEFRGLMEQSAISFEGMAKTLERQIGSVIDALTHTVLTTDNNFAWGVAEKILGDKKSVITSMVALSGEYDIKTTGISGYINKLQTQNKLLALLNTLIPVVQLGVNIRPLIKGILRANEDVVENVDEVFPDIPTYDINTILAVLSKISPELPTLFQRALMELGGSQGGGPSGMRGEAQPSAGGMNETAASPLNWLAGGGSQG
jgi:hypothetical protein